MRLYFLAAGLILVVGLGLVAMRGQKPVLVGDQVPAGLVIPVGEPVKPAGKTVSLPHRPSQVVVLKDGSAALVLDEAGLSLYALPSLELRQRLPISGGSSMIGLALSPDESLVAASTSRSRIAIAALKNGNLTWTRPLELPKETVSGDSYPCGLAFSADGNSLFACGSRSNRLVQFEMTAGKVIRDIPVDPAPFSVSLSTEGVAYVSCWGRAPTAGEETADASGTKVPVDNRGIVAGAVLDRVDLSSGTSRSIAVGRQPSNIETLSNLKLIPSANEDCLQLLSPQGQVKRIDLAAQFGRMCSPTWATFRSNQVAVALGRSNRLAVFDWKQGNLRLNRVFKTGWYPSCVVPTPEGWLVSCAEGWGSRGITKDPKSHNVFDYDGTLSLIPYDSAGGRVEPLDKDLIARRDVAPVPVPERVGEPSVFHHVIYVLKENRTYDQVFGDMKQGNGSAALCDYPRRVTPNQHKLAEQFGLLDNYYCDGLLSADGHAWAMEGNATSYFERTFGGWTRSYPYGDDPLSVSSSGFIWNDVLAHHRSFKNYGEFDYATPKPNDGWTAVYKDSLTGGTGHQFVQNIGVKSLLPYTRPGYPGWNLDIPDQVRADIFLKDLKSGVPLADFTILYLPQDHTSGDAKGAPTPQAMVADNDLALGRVVEGLSHSPYWRDTVLFANEDDPQAGYDHVDGHRSTCIVASAYCTRNRVNSQFYNQTSVLHTIERILAIPPLNRMDAESPLMTDCFTVQPDLTPFNSVPNQVPLDEMNGGPGHKLSFVRPDMNSDDLMNRILWKAAHPGVAYPEKFVAKSADRDGDD